MSQWSEPVRFSDSESDPSWTMRVIFLLASPEFQPATDASIIEDLRVVDRSYRRGTPDALDRTSNLERRLCEFVGQPLATLAGFMFSLKDVYGHIDMPLASPDAHPYPLAEAIARCSQTAAERWLADQQAASKREHEQRTAQQDADAFGMGFEVDGRRVAPDRVRVFTPSAPRD